MTSMITIDMRLYGAFRIYGDAVSFQVPAGSTAPVLRAALDGVLDGKNTELIHDSVLADAHSILGADHIFESDAHLSILPPVCGG